MKLSPINYPAISVRFERVDPKTLLPNFVLDILSMRSSYVFVDPTNPNVLLMPVEKDPKFTRSSIVLHAAKSKHKLVYYPDDFLVAIKKELLLVYAPDDMIKASIPKRKSKAVATLDIQPTLF